MSMLNEINETRDRLEAVVIRVERLYTGQEVILPKREGRAKAMIAVAEHYLLSRRGEGD
jgi:hypothetical protein